MPGFIKPQLATLKGKAPAGEQWIHEIKFNGYPVQVHLNRGNVKVFTRNGHDWTKRFSAIAGAFHIKGQSIFDGEVVVVHEGRTNFSELQADLATGRQDRMAFYAFDLPYHSCTDLRPKPQIERKAVLRTLTAMLGSPIVYSEHVETDGDVMFAAFCKPGWEGIISQNAESPYRNEGWLKVKCVMKGKFPVIGYVKDPTGIAALYLGRKERTYMGKSGRAGPVRSPARSASSLIPSSPQDRSSPNR